MNPISKKNPSEKKEINYRNSGRTEQANSKSPRAYSENTVDETSKSPLCIREFSMGIIEETSYSKAVNKVTRLRILSSIETINTVFTYNKKTLIHYNEQDSIEILAVKVMQGYQDICQYGLRPVYLTTLKLMAVENAQKRNQILEQNEISSEQYTNGALIWATLQRVYERDKTLFPKCKLNKDVNLDDTIVQNIDPIINQANIDLNLIIEEYFSIFRSLLDPNVKFAAKKEIIAHFNPSFSSVVAVMSLNTLDKTLSELEAIKILIDLLSTEVATLQNLLECLHEIKHAPKTPGNLTIIHKIIKICYDNDYKKIPNDNLQNDPNWNLRFKIKLILRDLALELAKPINEATIKNNAILQEKLKSTNQNNSLTLQINASPKISLNNKQEQEQKQKSLIQTLSKVEQTTSPATFLGNSKKETSLEIQDSKIEKTVNNAPLPLKDRKITDMNEAPQVQAETEIPFISTTNIETITDIIVLDTDSDKDNLDDIEIEANSLMEVLRQLFDKDRAAKIQLKQAKLNKAKIDIEEKNDIGIGFQSTSELLNNNHQETIKALFQNKPAHLTILGKEVQSLITALGGKSIGTQGSKYQIIWDGSNKKAGEYEITHGGDKKGYLTSEYATRVADAIHIGIKYNCIEKGLFPQELFIIIQNHITSHNYLY